MHHTPWIPYYLVEHRLLARAFTVRICDKLASTEYMYNYYKHCMRSSYVNRLCLQPVWSSYLDSIWAKPDRRYSSHCIIRPKLQVQYCVWFWWYFFLTPLPPSTAVMNVYGDPSLNTELSYSFLPDVWWRCSVGSGIHKASSSTWSKGCTQPSSFNPLLACLPYCQCTPSLKKRSLHKLLQSKMIGYAMMTTLQ